MGDEPRNSASDLAYTAMRLANDRETAMSADAAASAAPTFRRIDRRRVGALPDLDFDGYIESLVALEEIVGCWVTTHIEEIVAVRGERLVVARGRVKAGELGEIPYVLLGMIDEALERGELMCVYDPEDVHLALAEMDRLHAELTG